jgi:putative redox protein
MEAIVKQVNGLSLMGKANSNHWISIDAAEEAGGNNAAAKPMELVLLGLGGCTLMDVISILKKKRAPIKNIDVALAAEQAKDYPKIFTSIIVKFIIYGDKENINPADVERAIELSSKQYCSVAHMIKGTAKIEYEYEILNP